MTSIIAIGAGVAAAAFLVTLSPPRPQYFVRIGLPNPCCPLNLSILQETRLTQLVIIWMGRRDEPV